MTRLSIEQAIGLAMEHHRAGRLQQAEAMYRQILAGQPDQPDALHLLGLVLAGDKRFEEAIGLIQRAVAQHPDVPDYSYNLAKVLEEAGRDDEAIEAYRKAIAHRRGFFEAMCNLGAVLSRLGRFDEAIDTLEAAAALRPDSAEAQVNIGVARVDRGDLAGGIESYRRALAISPDYPPARYNLATTLLIGGRLEEAWDGYEWRWRVGTPPPSRPKFTVPEWDGSPLDGRRILLWPEQGFGDMIQFVRYAPMVNQRGGQVMLAAPTELADLVRTAPGVQSVLTERRNDPPVDLHFPLMSLPRLFKTTLATIPSNVPYLSADTGRAEPWRRRLTDDPTLKVGLAWAGRPTHTRDRQRSMPVSALAPLAEVRNVTFCSLQKRPPSEQALSAALPLEMKDFTADLTDFAQTAALISNLDLVIAVDTAVAHLAGALGKPVWILLAAAPDWRWMLDRSDSPWYPTARLFRQPRLGDWDSPMQQVVTALRDLV